MHSVPGDWFATPPVDPLAPESRRPRPVAGLPPVDPREVARAWLLELIAGATLEEAGALPTAELVAEGPALAAALLAALSDERALARLAPGGDLAAVCSRAAGLAAPAGGAGAVRAAEALRRATQSSILAAARLDPVTTAELADRLAHACAVVAEAAAGQAPATAAPAVPAADPRPAPIAAPEGDVVELHRAPAEREEHGSHVAAIGRRLERHAHDGSPFAVLAVEADGLERLLASQAGDEVDRLLESLERALAAELRPADQLLREQPGRYWVTAPDTGPTVGRLLAERLAEAATASSHRGAPLAVSIGVAACPEDGESVESLVDRADRALFRARAAGTPVV
jgi:diguanylate cyclase (GGDEF)-like protein